MLPAANNVCPTKNGDKKWADDALPAAGDVLHATIRASNLQYVTGVVDVQGLVFQE